MAVNIKDLYQGHPTTVFGEISVRSPLEWLKFSGAQEQLKISKMFRGDCSLGSRLQNLGYFSVLSSCSECFLTKFLFQQLLVRTH